MSPFSPAAARAPAGARLRATCVSVLVVGAIAGAVTACGGASGVQASSPPDETSIAAIHRRKCGACHVLPVPGTRTREHVEDAFTRHQRRVQLTPDQWSAMVDYMSAPAANATPSARPGATQDRTPDATGAPPQGLN